MSEMRTSDNKVQTQELELFEALVSDPAKPLKKANCKAIYTACSEVKEKAQEKEKGPSFLQKVGNWFNAKWTIFSNRTWRGGSEEKLLNAIVSQISLDPATIHSLRWYDDKTIATLGVRHMLLEVEGAEGKKIEISDDLIKSAVAHASDSTTKLALATLTSSSQNTIIEQELQEVRENLEDFESKIDRFEKHFKKHSKNPQEDLVSLLSGICNLQDTMDDESIEKEPIIKKEKKFPQVKELLRKNSEQIQKLEKLKESVIKQVNLSFLQELETLDISPYKMKGQTLVKYREAEDLESRHKNDLCKEILDEVLRDNKVRRALKVAKIYGFEPQVQSLSNAMKEIERQVRATINLEIGIRKEDIELARERQFFAKEKKALESGTGKYQSQEAFEKDYNAWVPNARNFAKMRLCLYEFQDLQSSFQSKLESFRKLSQKDPSTLTLQERQEIFRLNPDKLFKELSEKQSQLLELAKQYPDLREDLQVLIKKTESFQPLVTSQTKTESQIVQEPVDFSIYNSERNESVVISIAPNQNIEELIKKIADTLHKSPKEIAILYAGKKLVHEEILETLLSLGATKKNEFHALRWVEIPQTLTAPQKTKLKEPQKAPAIIPIEKSIYASFETELTEDLESSFSIAHDQVAEGAPKVQHRDLIAILKAKHPQVEFPEDSELTQMLLKSYAKTAAELFNKANKRAILKYRREHYREQQEGEHEKIFGDTLSLKDYIYKRSEDNPFFFPDDPRDFHQDAFKVFVTQLKKTLPKELVDELQKDLPKDLEPSKIEQETDKLIESLAKEGMREVIRDHNIRKKIAESE